MRGTQWILIMLLALALLGAPQAWAAGRGMGQGNGRGNQARVAQQQGQWVNNTPPGWNNTQGKRQGWTRHDSNGLPVGLNNNFNNTGKYPKGLQKTR